MQKLLIVLQIISILYASCGEGCLSCATPTDTCLVCDQAYGYFYSKDTGQCVQLEQDSNCVTFNFLGDCLQCVTNFYVDSNTLTCVEVPSSSLVTNCAQYGSNQKCLKCQGGHYLQQNVCTEVQNTILDCLYYTSDAQCSECQENFTVSLNQSNCLPNPVINHCKTFTNVACEKCSLNSAHMEDANLKKIQDLIENFQGGDKLLEQLDIRKQTSIPIEQVCYMNRLSYCRKYQDFETCELCQIGYQWYRGQCYIPQSHIIKNCAQQKSSRTCEICEDGYYLIGLSKCTAIRRFQMIDKCTKYITENRKPACSQCEDDYYLFGKQCILRDASATIEGCDEYSFDSDTCQECDSGKQLTTDGLKCLDEIEHCQSYEDSTTFDTELTCSECRNGYYVNEGTCEEGDISDCQVYQADENTCDKCQETYYLSEGECVKHPILIKDCKILGYEEPNVCEECENAYKKMEIRQICQLGQIDKCKIYESENVCKECLEDYELTDPTTCTLTINQSIRQSSNLRNADNATLDCQEGELPKNDVCQSVPEFLFQNCDILDAEIESTNMFDQRCQVCAEDTIPYNTKNQNVCISQSELQNLSQSDTFVLIDKCIAYKSDSNVECKQCEEEYILNDNACVDTCPPGEIKFDEFFTQDSGNIIFEKNTVCITQQQGVDSLVYDQDLEPVAFDLQDGYQYEMDVQRTDGQYKLVESTQIPIPTTSTDLFKLPMHKSILELPDEQIVDNCQFYINRGDDVYICQVCKFGYFSEITNIAKPIDNCYEYSNDFLCSICISGYILSDDKKTCTDATISSCIQYEVNTAKCLLCADNYYRQDLNTCTINNIQNCEIKHKFKNTCIKCNDNLYQLKNTDGDIIQCLTKIQYCEQYEYISDTLQCSQCQLGYYPTDNTRISCTQGNISGCIEYDQENINTCLYYNNIIQISQINQCVDNNIIYGCAIYNDDRTQCLFCSNDKQYYSNEGLCCDHGTYPVNGDNDQSACNGTSTNCKIWQYNNESNTYECIDCLDNYQLDPDTNTCCNIGEQVIQGSCTSDIPFNTSNNLDCVLYNYDNNKCLQCSSGKYISNDKCCDIGYYNNGNNICIQIEISDCIKMDNDTVNCQECDTGYTLNNNQCLLQNTNKNCDSYIYNNDLSIFECETCLDDTYYMLEDNIACCLKGTDSQTAQIWDQTLNSNQGGCIDVSTQVSIDNCNLYDQDLNCLQCTSENDVALYPSNNLQCCQSGFTSFNQNCVSTDYIYEKCGNINNSSDDFCNECISGYYESNGMCVRLGQYFPIDDTQDYENPFTIDIQEVNTTVSPYCVELSSDGTECVKCVQGYFLPDQNKQICCSNLQIYSVLNQRCEGSAGADLNCLLYDTTSERCYENANTTILYLTYGYCKKQQYISYYTQGSNTICCPYGQHTENKICVDNIIDCKIQKSTKCIKCNDGFHISRQETSCIQNQEGCKIGDYLIGCLECIDGYVLTDSNTNSTKSCQQYPAEDQLAFKNQDQCSHQFLTSSQQKGCFTCNNGFYSSDFICCEVGYYYNDVESECLKIPQDNCYSYELQGADYSCKYCFVDKQSNIYDEYLVLEPIVGSVSFESLKIKEYNRKYNHQYEIAQLDCCERGQYRLQGQCVNINSSYNCQEGISQNGQFICVLCNDGYYSSQGVCCMVTQTYNVSTGQCENDGLSCTDRVYQNFMPNRNLDLNATYNYYLSNNKCCIQGNYYDVELQKCVPLLDLRCLESDSKFQCTQCTEGLFPIDYFIKAEQHFRIINGVEEMVDEHYYKLCDELKNNASAEKNYYYENCQSNNKQTSFCLQCDDGYYLQDGYCCLDYQFHINGLCVDKSVVMYNCLQYDQTNFQCILCNTGYHLSSNICCQDNYEFSHVTKQCVKAENCDIFANEIGLCIQCAEDHYSKNGQCCQYGTYHDLLSKTCVAYDSSNIQYCVRGTRTECQKCQENIEEYSAIYNVYLSSGKCCKEGQYNNGTECVDIPLEENCAQYRTTDIGRCYTCNEGYHNDPISNKCCPLYYYYDGLTQQCEFKDHTCEEPYVQNGEEKCKKCASQFGYNLSFDKCCLNGTAQDSENEQCVDINEYVQDNWNYCTNVAEVADLNDTYVCSKCLDYYYVSGDVYSNSNNLSGKCCPLFQFADDNGDCININDDSVTLDINIEDINKCSKIETTLNDSDQQISYCIECETQDQILVLQIDPENSSQISICENNTTYQNCSYQNNTTGQQECLNCYDPYNYYTTGKNCCRRGIANEQGEIIVPVEIEDNNGQCVEATTNIYCSFFEEGECVKCMKTYYLSNDGNCVQQVLDDNDCIQKNSSGVCQVCKKGYYLDSSDNCQIIVSSISAKSNCSADSNGDCVQCFDDQVLTNNACCQQWEFYNQNTQLCQSIFSTLDGCLQRDQGYCTQCNNELGYYLVQSINECCPSGQTFISNQCVVPSSTGLSECQVFLNETVCRSLTETEKQNGTVQQDCQNNKYLSNGHCCSLQSYWNGTSCVVLTNEYTSCTKVNNSECLECKTDANYYISNGICCTIGTYFNGTSCVTIEQTLLSECDQVQDQKCTNCFSGTLTDQGCCQPNTTNIGGQCVANNQNCLEMKDQSTCQICQDTYYLTNNNCCQNSQIYDSGSCQNITNLYPQLIDCAQVDSDGNCKICQDGQSLTNNRCCESSEYFDLNEQKCMNLITLSGCIQLDENFNCVLRENISYLSNGNECQSTQYYNVDMLQCQDINVEGCTQANDPNICLKCQSGMTIQKDICCPSRHVLLGDDNTIDKCISIDTLTDNCANFNTINLLCDTCSERYYREEGQKACCLYGQNFDENTQTCIDNTVQNCQRQVDQQCLQCSDNYRMSEWEGTYYCCKMNQYLNTQNTPVCTNISINNCIKAVFEDNAEKCVEYAEIACSSGEVFNKKTGQCVDEILNCNKYVFDSNNDLICDSCDSTYILLQDQTTCCSQNSFYSSTSNSCFSNLTIADSNCATVNIDTFQCTSCSDQEYLTEDNICCAYGTYRDGTETDNECNGDINTQYGISNCAIYGISNCTKCMDEYVLNDSFECIQIPVNCEIYDEQNLTCQLCKDTNQYISNGYCCAKETYYDGTNCITPEPVLENCKEYVDDSITQCKKCSYGYYVTNQQFCCTDGDLCLQQNTSISGEIANCKEYGNNVLDCNKCRDGHSLTQIYDEQNDTSLDFCLAFQNDDCLYSTITTINSVNSIECQQCDTGKQTQIDLSSTQFTHNYIGDVNCNYYQIQSTLDQSTLKCNKCNNGYYLNGQNICIQRTNSDTNCIDLHPNNDTCSQCAFGFEIVDNECTEITLTNCDTPISTEQCGICDTNFTLLGSLEEDSLQQAICTSNDELIDNSTGGTQVIEIIGQLENCVENPQCDDIYLNGLNPEISKYLSCHQCSDNTQIPFIHLKIENTQDNQNQLDNGVLMQDYFNTQTFGDDSHLKNHSSECYSADVSDFNIVDTTTYVFPDNCGIGAINGNADEISLNQTDQSDIDLSVNTLSVFCVACKPGYKPTYSNLNFHVISCDLIDNCETFGSAFNQCDQCSVENTFLYDDQNQTIDKSICIEIESEHTSCYAYDQENDECKICKKGYSLNFDGLCESLQINKCQDGQSNIQDTSYLLSEYELAFYSGGQGCQQCQEGYHQFYMQQDNYVCLESIYIQSGSFQGDSSTLDINCSRFQTTSQSGISCYECNDTFVLDTSNNCLNGNANLVNCQVAVDENNCDTCIQGDYYLNDSNVCTLKNIDFCSIYTDTQDEEVCQQCQPLYAVSEGSCIEGNIQDCYIYQDEDNCRVCKEGYSAERNGDGNYVCVLSLIFQTCLEFDSTYFAQGILVCQQCANGYFQKVIEQYKDVCYPLQEVEGCEIYDKNISNQFQIPICLKCQTDYFERNQTCFKRQARDQNCVEYETYQDKCKKCALDYHLVNLDRNCERQLTEIEDCRLYSELGQCEVCKIETHLFNQQCAEVLQINIVENCYRYDQDQLCQKCNFGYYLLNNFCYKETTKIKGCETYVDFGVCGECQKGYQDVYKKGVLTCKKKKSIKGCKKMQDQEPYYCDICDSNYYPVQQGKSCKILKDSELIPKCYRYNEQKNCDQCFIQYALSADGQRCDALKDTQMCLKSIELEEPICAFCDEGYILDEDNQCQLDENAVQNCLIMGSYEFETCAICMSGFYMNETQNCVRASYNNQI